MTAKIKLPVTFWMIAVLLLFWSIADAAVFLIDLLESRNPDVSRGVDLGTMTRRPLWYLCVLGLAIFSGLTCAALLLMRKKVAVVFAYVTFFAILIDISFGLYSRSQGVKVVYNWDLLYTILFFDLVLVIFSVVSLKKGWIK